jgi:predicted metal-dependent peptidase
VSGSSSDKPVPDKPSLDKPQSDDSLVQSLLEKSQRVKLQNIAVDRARQALRLASASVPHLSGLARLVRLKPSRRVEVAAVSASGLVLFQPDVFADIPLGDAAFVLAHELMHLALDTHGRQGDAAPLLANFAHDFIINDILREELRRDPPLGGLDMPQARERSLEELMVDLSKQGAQGKRCWRGGARKTINLSSPQSNISRALQDAGLVEPPPSLDLEIPDRRMSAGDLIPQEREQEFEPEIGPDLRQKLTDAVRKAAAKAAALSQLGKRMEQAADAPADTGPPQRGSAMMQAIRAAYAAPWELALQRWMDAVAPGERTYARPSRRGVGGDVVRPGRFRQGWVLHIILDTSGSMSQILPKALGAIAIFCEAANVAEVHLLQCDQEVTSDRWIEPEQLAEFEISGFGYSDMSPAIRHLAADPEVEAALVLTDGYIDYPQEPPPYRVLWALIGDYVNPFTPLYGEVVYLPQLRE